MGVNGRREGNGLELLMAMSHPDQSSPYILSIDNYGRNHLRFTVVTALSTLATLMR